jgi:hypothetical protein
MNDNERLQHQFDPDPPYQPMEPSVHVLDIDQEVRVLEEYRDKIRKQMKPYVPRLLGLHLYRIQKEWFYRFFYQYRQCDMDKALKAMFDYMCKAHPLYLAKNKLIKDVFDKVYSSDDILTKRWMMLIFIGTEPDIGNHIYTLTEQDLDRHVVIPESPTLDFSKIRSLVFGKTKRLITSLPGLVHALKTESPHQHNIIKIGAHFLFRCMMLYETGMDIGDLSEEGRPG